MTDPVKKKSAYEAPQIAFEEVVEAIAGTCTSAWFDEFESCRYDDSCENIGES